MLISLSLIKLQIINWLKVKKMHFSTMHTAINTEYMHAYYAVKILTNRCFSLTFVSFYNND